MNNIWDTKLCNKIMCDNFGLFKATTMRLKNCRIIWCENIGAKIRILLLPCCHFEILYLKECCRNKLGFDSECLVIEWEQADHLRQQTMRHMSRILTTHQAARALLALGEFFHRLQALSSLWAARPCEPA